MSSFRVLIALFVMASAEPHKNQNTMSKEVLDGMHQAMSIWKAYKMKQMKQRRLDAHMPMETCWDDCVPAQNDTDTVCKKPEKCSNAFWEDSCVSDCKSKMETMIVCESKQFCVDNKAEGGCPTTLGLVQGAADNGVTAPCAVCKEHSDELVPVLEMAGMGTMDMDTSKMTMGMISEDMCPKTKAAGQCALDNADPCMDTKKSSDSGMLFFAALCDCPCGGKLAKFLWDIDTMMMDACTTGLKDGFKKPLPGMAEMGPILFSSGLLECLGCKWNENACMTGFNKWLGHDEGMAGLMTGLMSMKGKCDEETTTTTTTTTTTEAPTDAPDSTSFASRSSTSLVLLTAVLVAMKLA